MKTWIRRTLLAAFGASIALGGLAACGHRAYHHGWSAMSAEEQAKFREKAVDRVASRLELDAAQRLKLDALVGKLQAQRAALAAQGDPRAEIRALVAAEKFDRARAQAFVAQKTATIASASPEVIAALADFYDSLQPAQQAKVRQFMERRRGWWRS